MKRVVGWKSCVGFLVGGVPEVVSFDRRLSDPESVCRFRARNRRTVAGYVDRAKKTSRVVPGDIPATGLIRSPGSTG